MRRIALWVVVLVAALVVGVAVLVRGRGISVHRNPFPLEEQIAKRTWRYLIPATARDAVNPAPNTAEAIAAGLEHFADHCAICHANNGSGDTIIGRRVYPQSPDMRQSGTQNLTDGELFYAIEEGIPFTAMPGLAEGTPKGELESWHLVRFIRYLPKLTAAEISRMERLNPKSPATEARDREIDDFLSGKSVAPKKMEHRHK